MILGLLLDAVGIPFIPMVIIILSFFVLIIGFVFLVYKHRAGTSIEAVDEARLKQFTHLIGYIFIVYAILELIAVAACICANDACRAGYHYPAGTPCMFCDGTAANTHSGASDLLMLGIFFDAFVVNSYIVAAINTVQDFLKAKQINL